MYTLTVNKEQHIFATVYELLAWVTSEIAKEHSNLDKRLSRLEGHTDIRDS
jgi:hypothetical protein